MGLNDYIETVDVLSDLEKVCREVEKASNGSLTVNEEALNKMKEYFIGDSEQIPKGDAEGFTRYSSIENSYQQKTVDFIAMYNIKEWAISEKIHGSNSCLTYITTGEEDLIKYAKRSGYVNEGENFFNLQQVIENMNDVTTNIKLVAKKYGYEMIEVFGEVFGGHYLHADVAPVKGATKVQKGVYYTPDNNFLAFDIRIDGEYVDVLKFQALCIEIGINFIPIEIFHGNVYEAIAYCETLKETPTDIYKLYNLPQIEDNIREGVVLKPLVTMKAGNGSRIILKIKGEKFSEKSHERKVVIQKDLPEELMVAIEKLSEYCTENRLANVISHLGEVTIKDFSAVMTNYLPDIYADFEKDGNSLNTFDKEARKMINKKLNSIVAPMIKRKLMELS